MPGTHEAHMKKHYRGGRRRIKAARSCDLFIDTLLSGYLYARTPTIRAVIHLLRLVAGRKPRFAIGRWPNLAARCPG